MVYKKKKTSKEFKTYLIERSTQSSYLVSHNLLPNDNFLGLSKMKAFADDKMSET